MTAGKQTPPAPKHERSLYLKLRDVARAAGVTLTRVPRKTKKRVKKDLHGMR